MRNIIDHICAAMVLGALIVIGLFAVVISAFYYLAIWLGFPPSEALLWGALGGMLLSFIFLLVEIC